MFLMVTPQFGRRRTLLSWRRIPLFHQCLLDSRKAIIQLVNRTVSHCTMILLVSHHIIAIITHQTTVDAAVVSVVLPGVLPFLRLRLGGGQGRRGHGKYLALLLQLIGRGVLLIGRGIVLIWRRGKVCTSTTSISVSHHAIGKISTHAHMVIGRLWRSSFGCAITAAFLASPGPSSLLVCWLVDQIGWTVCLWMVQRLWQLMVLGVLYLMLLVESGSYDFAAVRRRLGQVHDATIIMRLQVLSVVSLAVAAAPHHGAR